MRPRDTRHVPVLLDAVLRVINPRPGQTVVDCTVGLGGHSARPRCRKSARSAASSSTRSIAAASPATSPGSTYSAASPSTSGRLLVRAAMTGVPAAIANAVYNATGKRVRDLPITLDKLL